MKKLLILSALTLGALAGLSACKGIDAIQDLDEYTGCVVYAEDTVAGIGIATNYASINIATDLTTNLFQLTFTDLKLSPDANVQNLTFSGLTQSMKSVQDESGNTTDVLYTYFDSNGYAYTDGLTVRNLRFGWLSTIYWGHFVTGDTRVWCLPADLQVYANTNAIIDERYNQHDENAIQPRYDIELNTGGKTINIYGSGVTLPSQSIEAEKTFKFQSLKMEGLPIEFTKDGFTVKDYSFSPTTDGERNTFQITDFNLTFEADYDGTHVATYTMTHVASDTKIDVTTTFGFNRI